MARNKKAKSAFKRPERQKRPKSGVDEKDSIRGPSWRLARVDFGGPFGWGEVPHEVLRSKIYSRLCEFESKNFDQIKRTGSHTIPLNKLSKEAVSRLKEIGQDDIEALFSFRLTGKERIFCIKNRDVYDVLWWDPNHLVCPAPKKHT